MHNSLEDYIHEIASGDLGSLEKLYIQTKPVVFGFALSILKNLSDAEDVTQDTYINIHHYASRYKSKNKPLAWILTITKNLAYNKIKVNNHTQELTNEELESLISQNGDYNICLIKEMIDSLNDEERKIIVLSIIGGLKFHEIAKLLDLKLSTTLSKYNRAIKKLSSKYKEENNEKC